MHATNAGFTFSTSEGMSPGNTAQYGSNGRVYAARLIWEKPNRAWNRH